jgi:hypothetical protein
VEVQLQLTDRAINLVEDAYDLGIRFGELPDTRLGARKILSNHRYLCASPAYLKRNGVPHTAGAGAAPLHPAPPERRQLQHLEAAKGRKHETVKVHGSLSSNDGDVVLGWALDGHGILLRSEWDAAKYLDSGRLQVILPDYTLPSADLYAYYPSRQQQPARARAFIDFLVERIPAATAPRQANSGMMKSQSSGAPVALNVQTIHVVNRSRATPSKRPKRCCGSCSRSTDHTSTTLPSRQANRMWNGVNGSGAPPSAALTAPSCACAKAKLHGVAKGAVTMRSYSALPKTILRKVVVFMQPC